MWAFDDGSFRDLGAATGSGEELYDKLDDDEANSPTGPESSPEAPDDTISDNSSKDIFGFKDDWEAPAMPCPSNQPDWESEMMSVDLDTEMTQMRMNPSSLEEDVNLDADERTDHQTHTALQQKQSKTFIDRYPGDAAGHPVSANTTMTPPIPDANHCYAERLKGQADDSADRSPYWLFTLQLDWEVARWAKMRGPGSTAVSELLNIDGVSLVTNSISV
ncbi:hypothetical protein JVU11DRAFT_1175 [Chiua virens]|nr:hypothetical protein JVU11DRAFT_1175 [Chiua virens]